MKIQWVGPLNCYALNSFGCAYAVKREKGSCPERSPSGSRDLEGHTVISVRELGDTQLVL